MLIRWTRPGEKDSYTACIETAGMSQTPAQVAFYLENVLIGTYVAEDDGRIVGTGSCIAYAGGTGWIGLITVLPEFRGKGLGRALTEWGIGALREKVTKTVVLAASAMGRPIYEKLGFEVVGEYLTMAGHGLTHPPRDARLRPMFSHDWPEIEALDLSATGEQRGELLKSMPTGYVLVGNDGRFTGFHIAAPWGGGGSVAADPEAGRIMIDLARSLRGEQAMRLFVPAANTEAVSYLAASGFEVAKRTTHMVLGPSLSPFAPERIWGAFSLGLG